jgi:hypothetical protein
MHDATEEQKRFTDAEAILHTTKVPALIATECIAEMRKRYGEAWTGLSHQQLKTRVTNTRRVEGGGVEKNRVETEHMSGGQRSFLRDRTTWVDDKGDKQEIMIFSKKELFDRMKVKGTQVRTN